MVLAGAARVVEARARVYRRTWRGSIISTFFTPILYLLAMGLGLGTLVDEGAGQATLDGVAYLTFLAPGLLAAATMSTGAGDASWPVMVGIRWEKTYHATLATPVTIADLVLGHLAWIAVRLTLVSVVFVGVMAAFGVVSIGYGLLAVLPAVLNGMAFAAPISAFAAWLDQETGLSNMFRFGIVPMFLFSGTFFPITQLPGWLQPLAYLTPLYHGVDLTRAAALGTAPDVPPALSITYLGVWVLVGLVLGVRAFAGKLHK